MKQKISRSDLRRIFMGLAILLLLIACSYFMERTNRSSVSSAVIEVQQNGKTVAYLTSDMISQLAEQQNCQAAPSEIALLDVLHAAGINRFASVILTGSNKEAEFKESEIETEFYLRPVKNGSVSFYKDKTSSTDLISAVSVIEVQSN